MIKIILVSASLILSVPGAAIAEEIDQRPLQDRVCDELARSPSALDECLSMAFPTPLAQCVEEEESRSDMESALVSCFFAK
jgi:hypothetical protein